MTIRCVFDSGENTSFEIAAPKGDPEWDALFHLYNKYSSHRVTWQTQPRIVAPLGKIWLGPQRPITINITKAAPEATIVNVPFRIRTSRQLTAQALSLATARPDMVVVGGFYDWIVQLTYNQPHVDVDEFAIRVNWVADLLCRDLGITVLFIYGGPLRDEFDPESGALHLRSVAEIYLQTLKDISRRIERFFVFEANSYFADLSHFPTSYLSHPRESEAEARRKCLHAFRAFLGTTLKKSQFTSRRLHGFRAFLDAALKKSQFTNRRRAETMAPSIKLVSEIEPPFAPRWLKIVDRQLALPKVISEGDTRWSLDDVWQRVFGWALSQASEPENEGPDEGAAVIGKNLFPLGGRNFFERSIQFAICVWLKQHYRLELPRVMIVGDSIRMRIANGTGYGIVAYRHLLGRCNLIHVPHNCGNSRVGVTHFRNWLEAEPDIIHANHGLHDLALTPTGEHANTYISPRDFELNLRRIVDLIKSKSKATLIWGLCTPVDEEWHKHIPGRRGRVRSVCRSNDDIRRYNEIALRVMQESNVPVTDLFTPLLRAGIRSAVLPDGVHLNSRGAAILGRLVADAVLAHVETSADAAMKDRTVQMQSSDS